MRIRRRYFIGENEWYVVWKPLPKHEVARVRWATKEIELSPYLRKLPPGEQEFLVRHELLHALRGRPRRNEHLFAGVSHRTVVELGMRLDNLIHFGKDTFKGNV